MTGDIEVLKYLATKLGVFSEKDEEDKYCKIFSEMMDKHEALHFRKGTGQKVKDDFIATILASWIPINTQHSVNKTTQEREIFKLMRVFCPHTTHTWRKTFW